MINSKPHLILNSNITWEDTIKALGSMQHCKPNPALQKQISFVVDTLQESSVNPHLAHVFEDRLLVTSLFQERFMMLFGSTLATFTDVFSVVDFETPHSYNLGRNVATTIVFSKHHELMIKTITGTNFKHFKRVFFRDYFALVESNPNTLIAKIYGVFSIEQPESKTPVHLVLMENLFHPTFGGQVEMVFDLKGASVNRHHSEFKQLIEQQRQGKASSVTLKGKDNDFLLLNDRNPIAGLSTELKVELLGMIKKETSYLQQSRIMDYSLMVVVTRVESANPGIRCIAIDTDKYLTIGIIDYLQDYNPSKKLESKMKTFLGMFKQNNVISCIDSEKYRQRFLDYCEKLFL